MTMFQGSSSSDVFPRFLNPGHGNPGRVRSEGKVEVQDKVSSSAFSVHPYYRRHDHDPDVCAAVVAIGMVALAISGFIAAVYWLTKVL